MQSLRKHLPHYISLVGIFTAGILGFYLFPYDNFFHVGVVMAVASAYVSWGIIHHAIHKDICLPIVLEYFTIALLGVVIAISLIYRT